MTAFGYQDEGASFLANGGLLLADEPGLGKSRQALEAARLMGARTILVVCPAIALGVWKHEVAKWRPELAALTVKEAMKVGRVPKKDRVLITSFDMLVANAGLREKIGSIQHDLLLLDECFPTGTLVETPNGAVPIEQLQVGDPVLGFDHATGRVVLTTVKHTFRRSSDAPLVKVGGVRMTWNHPVWTRERGYVMACTVRNFETVGYINGKILRTMRAGLHASEAERHEAASILLQELCAKDGVGSRDAVERDGDRSLTEILRILTTSVAEVTGVPTLRAEPIPRSGDRSESSGCAPFERLRRAEWGQRSPVADTSEDLGISAGMADRGGHPDAEDRTRAAERLQNRHRQYGAQGGRGGRRSQPPVESRHGEGREEGPDLGGFGMEGDPGHEQRSESGPNVGRSTDLVFNLETGTCNYFAGGLLVHNCHQLKNPRAKRTMLIYGAGCAGGPNSLVGRVGATRILTGTPVLNNNSEVFSHLRALSPDRIEQKSYQAFVDHYCLKGVRTVRSKSGQTVNIETIEGSNPATTKELAWRLKGFWLKRRVEDVKKDLPPLRVEVRRLPAGMLDAERLREVEESAEAKELWRAIRTGDPEALRHLEGHMARLRRLVAMAKVRAAAAWAEGAIDAGEPKVAVWGLHIEALGKIRDALEEHGVVYIDGSTSQKKREAAVRRFQEDPTCKAGVFQIQAAGTALTMTACRRVVMMEQAWTPALNTQAVKRHHRIGSTNAVLAEVLAAPGLDEAVAGVLSRKMADISALEQGE